MKPKIRMTVEQLEDMLKFMKDEIRYDSMTAEIIITMEHHPNGRAYLQFEQPCAYHECNSSYRWVDETERDYKNRMAE